MLLSLQLAKNCNLSAGSPQLRLLADQSARDLLRILWMIFPGIETASALLLVKDLKKMLLW
jgi:hypothetical protein